jgi:subtilisin-like proprotein convertase family protein
MAVASSTGGGLVYTASSGEQNAVVLSPGAFFSIQDDAGVSQVGTGGCVSSAYLAALNWSVSVSIGSEFGIDPQWSWAVGVGFGAPLIPFVLPDGIICPSPAGLSTDTSADGLDAALQQMFGTATRGVSSVVAGAAVTDPESVYYNVSASTGFVDEYRLYQCIVDPASAIQETESNNKFSQADTITTNTLVRGNFAAGSGDVDFYKFYVQAGDRIAVVLDNNALGDGKYANTRLTIYDSTGTEIASNVSFSEANAVGAITVPNTLLPGPYYISVTDAGFGEGSDYRFVVIKTTSSASENTSKPVTFSSGTLNTPITDVSTTESTMSVGVDNMFARASSMSVTLNIEHTYDHDLSAYLISPSGTVVTLFSNADGSGDNFTNTTFSDSATTWITSGSAPFTGTFHPVGNLSDFAADLINGDWTLRVVDGTGGDVGTLVSWSLTFNDTSNDAAANADPLSLNQYVEGKVSSSSDTDYFKVTDSGIKTGDLVFAYVDTTDTDGENGDSRDSFLQVIGADGTTVLGQNDDSGPAVTTSSYNDLNKQIKSAGVDLNALDTLFTGGITVSLGDGSDSCDASKINLLGQTITIDGGSGDDTIYAPGGDNVHLLGGSGNDTFVLNSTYSATGTNNTIDGGSGTNNIIEINDPTGNLSITLSFDGSLLVITVGNVVSQYVVTNIQGISINGGYQLAVEDVGTGDCTIWRQGSDGLSGSLTIGSLPQISYTGIPYVKVLPVSPVTDGYGADGVGRVVVFDTDPMESNDSRRTATDFSILQASHLLPTIDLGADSTRNVPADEDWYRFVATETGTFCFQLDYESIGTLSNGNSGLPGDGLLLLNVYDADGNPITKASSDVDGSQTLGVQKGVTYYVRVRGATSDAVNVYNIKLTDVDTSGPQVTSVSITGNNSYNLFSQKNSSGANSPTPLIYSLTIGIQDLVARYPGYLYGALDTVIDSNPGHYRLVGDANGVISIASVKVVNDTPAVGGVATGHIELIFSEALPDDRYTLTLFADLVDPAGNALDGETNAIEAHTSPIFPSGDSVAGGDFTARFTVDSRAEIGVWTAGSAYVDTNGNLQFDTTTTDATNRDYAYSYGYTTDAIFAGNFVRAATAKADGFSKLAAYGKVSGMYQWRIDTNNDGIADLIQTDTANIVGTPVAGNFDGNAANGDEVGVFDGKTWYLDGNHDFQVRNSTADRRITNGMSGAPIVGDFDGDGKTDLATYLNGNFYFDFASNGYGKVDTSLNVGYLYYAGARLKPVAADMDGDGITDIGLWCPDRAGVSPTKVGEWYFLVSNDPTGTLRRAGYINRLRHSFSQVPPSKDIFARLGSEFSVPLVGNFDPPVVDGQGSLVASTDLVTVSLVGTAQNDTFVVAPGSATDTWVITVNGKSQTIQAHTLNLSIGGGGGRDTITVTGTAADDQIECWPNQATIVGSGYTISVRGMASIVIGAGGGNNTAKLHGTKSNDVLTASSKSALLSGSSFSSQVLGAGQVTVDGGPGGSDSATLIGTSSADVFVASPASASLSGTNYSINLKGFRTVRAQASTSGGSAKLVGSTGKDTLTALAKSSTLSGNGFVLVASGFGVVSVDGGGGIDTASIADGLLDSSVGSALIGTRPKSYRSAVWLSHFSRISRNNKPLLSVAADKVFASYWK